MKALLYYGNKDIRLEEIEKPKPKSNEVLVKVKADYKPYEKKK